MSLKKRTLLFTGFLGALLLCGEEFLDNRDFSKSLNGVPAGWLYQKNRSNPEYRLNPADAGAAADVEIVTSAENAQGLLMFRKRKKYPAGTWITVSGEYRSKDVSFGRNGSILVSVAGTFDPGSRNSPKSWMNMTLKPAEQWTKFQYSRRLKYPIEHLQFNIGLIQAKL